MKSRRVLQIIVAALSVALLAFMALLAVVLVGVERAESAPTELAEFASNFHKGLDKIAEKLSVPAFVVPTVAFGAPALLLLLAAILILTKNKGKDTKNVVGCMFALIGVIIVTAFVAVFAVELLGESNKLVAWGACGGVLIVFVIFGECALGVKAKQAQTPVAVNEADETAENELDKVSHEISEREQELEREQDENRTFTPVLLTPPQQLVLRQQEEYVEQEEPTTPATQYVPHASVTIRDVVENTYGKENSELTSETIKKINKVRALFEANAITEEEYIKLIKKYLGFSY